MIRNEILKHPLFQPKLIRKSLQVGHVSFNRKGQNYNMVMSLKYVDINFKKLNFNNIKEF